MLPLQNEKSYEMMLEYNTGRDKLLIREYGRNIQKMVEHLLTIEDRELRSKSAKSIVHIMAQMSPDSATPKSSITQGDTYDYWHKFWDHLFIMSDYKLDIDAPYPKPQPETKSFKRETFTRNREKIRYRTYGRNMENVIRAVAKYPDEEREAMSKILANHLKKLYLLYNRETVEDTLILKQLEELSGGKIVLPADTVLENTKEILRSNQQVKVMSAPPKLNPPKKKKSKKKKAVKL
ncbi:MAG: DUF4290 domain-containing protein [Bacteroidales bacterium]|jgi:hypothetical protein|nr:DUF4290 domain-containing protein [Bacteroidales bacterium]